MAIIKRYSNTIVNIPTSYHRETNKNQRIRSICHKPYSPAQGTELTISRCKPRSSRVKNEFARVKYSIELSFKKPHQIPYKYRIQ